MDARLEALAELLADRGIPLGLIAESDRRRVLERHVLDCARAAALIEPADRALCDIGSGAGLPGLPIAILKPELRVILVEPRSRAVGLLELAVDRLGLSNVEIVRGRIEEVALRADVATTRAFASIEASWAAACRVLRQGGRLIYFAGAALGDPERVAAHISEPEAPTGVRIEHVIADSSPLVIMARGG